MELTLEEAALAWAQGKRVEASPKSTDRWLPVDGLGECMANQYSQSAFGQADVYRFRLASEPHAKKFRPWTPDEVPVGAIIKAKGKAWRSLIVGVTQFGGIQIHDGGFDTEFALENHMHSVDGGKTWLPCGVEVDA